MTNKTKEKEKAILEERKMWIRRIHEARFLADKFGNAEGFLHELDNNAQEKNIPECDCCGFDDLGLTHEPTCSYQEWLNKQATKE